MKLTEKIKNSDPRVIAEGFGAIFGVILMLYAVGNLARLAFNPPSPTQAVVYAPTVNSSSSLPMDTPSREPQAHSLAASKGLRVDGPMAEIMLVDDTRGVASVFCITNAFTNKWVEATLYNNDEASFTLVSNHAEMKTESGKKLPDEYTLKSKDSVRVRFTLGARVFVQEQGQDIGEYSPYLTDWPCSDLKTAPEYKGPRIK